MQNLSKYLSADFPTEQSIRDLVNGDPKVTRPRPRAYLLNSDLTPKPIPNPSNAKRPNDMTGFLLTAKIANNTSQDIHRDVDLQMLEVPGIERFDALTDYVQVTCAYLDRSRTRTVLEVPVGIFGFDITDRDLSASGNIWAIKGYDLTREVAATGFLDAYTVPAGYKVTDIVKAMLMECSLPPILPDGTVPTGARQASGLAWAQPVATQGVPSPYAPPPAPGDPYTFGPHGYYSPNGVRVEDVGTPQTIPATNQPIYQLPNGDQYPHFSGARVDATTYAPIDPWTGTVMTPVAGQPMIYRTQNGLEFNTLTSVIYQPFSGGTMPVEWDPFKWVTARTQYQRWDQGSNQYTGSTLPLASWPYDWDGSGPYYASPATDTQTAVPATPSVSATPVAWPDVNNPGLTPNGCPDVGPNIPAHRIFIQDSPVTLPFPITFTRKTNRLTAVNSLLKAINYWPLWVDENGTFRSSPMPYYYNFIPGFDWEYTTGEGGKPSTLRSPVKVSIADQTALYNIVQVVSEKNGMQPLVTTQYNLSQNSEISLTRLGKPRVLHIQDDNIRDLEVLKLRGRVELQFAALATQAVEWETWLNPFHQTNDFVGLNVWSPDGKTIEVDSRSYPFQENTWEMDFQAYSMKHVGGRIVPV